MRSGSGSDGVKLALRLIAPDWGEVSGLDRAPAAGCSEGVKLVLRLISPLCSAESGCSEGVKLVLRLISPSWRLTS